jgi:membrane protease YdiL (CAAX protease family)
MDANQPSPPLTPADRAAIAVALILPTAVTWLYFIALDGAPPWLQQGAYGIGKAIQFALPAVWVCLVQRTWPNFAAARGWSLIAGGVFGFVVGASMALLYFVALKPAGLFDEAAIAVRQKVQSFGAGSPVAFLLLAAFYSAVHSLLEEYYWRWFVFGELSRLVRLRAAITISSLAFAAHHVLVLAHYFGWQSPLTWIFAGGVTVGGAVWAWLYARGGSLVGAWLSHALIDAAIFAVGWRMITT